MTYRTRFAPSPTGPLHLGHAYSARIAHDRARAESGQFLLRIEDTDRSRAKPEWEVQIRDDLAWLGLTWDEDPWRQSDHRTEHLAALEILTEQGLVYPCSCSRADIRAALSAPHEGQPIFGPDGAVYPGTCRDRAYDDRKTGDALRLNIARAVDLLGDTTLSFEETGPIFPGLPSVPVRDLVTGAGDIVLGRRSTGDIAYHLAVVVDDAAQGITEVVRGADLFEATALHVCLQRLLDLPTPRYHHHRLVRDDAGKRLAKRDDARAIAQYRAQGLTPDEVWALAEAGL